MTGDLTGLGLLLTFIGIVVAILVSWSLGVLCILIGLAFLIIPAIAPLFRRR